MVSPDRALTDSFRLSTSASPVRSVVSPAGSRRPALEDQPPDVRAEWSIGMAATDPISKVSFVSSPTDLWKYARDGMMRRSIKREL